MEATSSPEDCTASSRRGKPRWLTGTGTAGFLPEEARMAGYLEPTGPVALPGLNPVNDRWLRSASPAVLRDPRHGRTSMILRRAHSAGPACFDRGRDLVTQSALQELADLQEKLSPDEPARRSLPGPGDLAGAPIRRDLPPGEFSPALLLPSRMKSMATSRRPRRRSGFPRKEPDRAEPRWAISAPRRTADEPHRRSTLRPTGATCAHQRLMTRRDQSGATSTCWLPR